jgi:hypothetical protein
MALVLRPAGYTGTLQQITWNQGNNVPATAYLWGGGGGAGGSGYTGGDNGGAGGGGQFSQVNFTVSDGDVLEVAVGGPGQGGENFTNNAAGGSPGASLLVNEIFNTRTATPISGPGGALFPQFNSRYCTFLNVNGVWINPSSAGIFDKTYTVTFPVTGNYQFQASADNSAKFYFDGVEVFTAFDYGTTYEVGYPVDAGTHTLRIVGTNTGGPGAVALTITTGSSYSGGRGGNSGSYGILTRVGGAGGGGGGATVLLKNGEVIGVAGGGGAGSGGGGGSGSRQDAPGTVGQAAPGQNSGQNGTTPINYWLIWNRGGGGGGGGGGLGGGNGGYTNSEILSVGAGSYGGGFGAVSNPVGRLPGGTTNQYWIPTVGYGGRQRAFGPGETGNGVGGYAMLAFDVSGIWVNESGQGWKQTRDVFAKANNTWNEVKGVWIKEAGVWEPVISSYAPNWTAISGRYGINPRAAAPDLTPAPPPEPAGGYEAGGYDGGGGGGECFTAGTLITMYDGTNKAIDKIVAGDLVLDALTGKPNKVIGIKSTEYEIGRKIFATQKGVTPFITEQHAFYNDQNELCAMSEECEYLAPWLGQIKIVDVPEIINNDQIQTVYNLMFETGNSHYANGVKVSNMVGNGNTYVLFMKGYLDKESYLGYIYHLENTVGLNALTQEQKARIYNIVSWMSNYVLHNNNVRSWILAKTIAWAIRNRTTLYPYIDCWFKSKLRRWLFRKNI